MEYQKRTTGNRGFALLVVFMIMSAVTIGLVMLAQHAFKGVGKNKITAARMHSVAAAMKKYYIGHHQLPLLTGNMVPVAELSLSTKYRFDGWGKFIHCNAVADNIMGITVDGKSVAMVLVSGGPDQEMDEATRPGGGNSYVSSVGDDIVLPVTLQSEAIKIATDTLSVLARKTCSYVCVNGESFLDNDDLDATDDMGALDGDGFTGGLAQIGLLLEFSLDTDSYSVDPWGNSYQWLGESSSPANSFRSLGPDGVVGSDDIVVAARTTLIECGCSSIPSPLAQFTFEADQVTHTGNGYHIKIDKKDGNGQVEGQFKGDAVPVDYDIADDHASDAPPTNSAGGSCVYFDGNHDYILMEQPAYFVLDEDFTLTAWFKTSGTLNAYAKVISRRTGAYKYYFLGSKGNGGTAHCDSGGVAHPYGGVLGGQDDYDKGGHQTSSRTIITMPCGEWHHVAVVFDHEPLSPDGSGNSTLSIYYDGVLQETRTGLPVSAPADNNIKLTIGADSGGGGGFFQGWIDNAALYDEALSEEQINVVMDKKE